MNSRAQVSIEYLVIAAAVLLLSLLVTAVSINFFSAKDSIKEQAGILSEGARELIQ